MALHAPRINPTVGAAIAGVAIGAAAVALSQKRNRDKLKKTAQALPGKGKKAIRDLKTLKTKAQATVSNGKKKISAGKQKLEMATKRIKSKGKVKRKS